MKYFMLFLLLALVSCDRVVVNEHCPQAILTLTQSSGGVAQVHWQDVGQHYFYYVSFDALHDTAFADTSFYTSDTTVILFDLVSGETYSVGVTVNDSTGRYAPSVSSVLDFVAQ